MIYLNLVYQTVNQQKKLTLALSLSLPTIRQLYFLFTMDHTHITHLNVAGS